MRHQGVPKVVRHPIHVRLIVIYKKLVAKREYIPSIEMKPVQAVSKVIVFLCIEVIYILVQNVILCLPYVSNNIIPYEAEYFCHCLKW